jgi:hypothetical protein
MRNFKCERNDEFTHHEAVGAERFVIFFSMLKICCELYKLRKEKARLLA